ncbi:hypothetical protein, partial [Methylomonas methanica]|uniref:hypothetical protein n=1 Tax=Methylomonas methanica TaxID=421 RepID=UPI0018D4B394
INEAEQFNFKVIDPKWQQPPSDFIEELFACVSDAFLGEAIFGRAFQVFLGSFCIATGFSGSDLGVFLAFFEKAIFGGASQLFLGSFGVACFIGRVSRLA